MEGVDDDDFGEFVDAVDDASPLRIDTVAILTTAHIELLPLINTELILPLKSAPYQLRKRVLSHPKTKTFLKGYVELLKVVSRVMAGRKRQQQSSAAADREARHVDRLWEEDKLYARVCTIIAAEKLPQISSRVVFGPTDQDVCVICGLTATELLTKLHNDEWVIDQYQGQGHKTCLAWYENSKIRQ